MITQASAQLSCYSIRMVTTFETIKKAESVQLEMVMESMIFYHYHDYSLSPNHVEPITFSYGTYIFEENDQSSYLYHGVHLNIETIWIAMNSSIPSGADTPHFGLNPNKGLFVRELSPGKPLIQLSISPSTFSIYWVRKRYQYPIKSIIMRN